MYGAFLLDVAGPYFQNNERRPCWVTKLNPCLVRPRTQAVSLLCEADAFLIRWPKRRVRHRNALTEKAWEDAVQGLGKPNPVRVKLISIFDFYLLLFHSLES